MCIIIFLTAITAFQIVGIVLYLNSIEEERNAKRYEDVVTISEEYFEEYQKPSGKQTYLAYHHYILTTDGRQFELDKDFFDYVREQTTDTFKIVYLNHDSFKNEGSKGEYSGYIEKIYLVNEGL